jgi:hypothetical protein
MDTKTQGAWIVHHTNKLDHFTDPGQFNHLRIAGKAGILLSALSTSDANSLTDAEVQTLATASDIDVAFALPPILDLLDRNGLIDKSTQGIDILGLTTPAVLEHTSSLFASLGPTPIETASLELAEVCSQSPTGAEDLKQYLGDTFSIGTKETQSLLQKAERFGFTDAEEIDKGRRIYFNGNLFRGNDMRKVSAVMSSLSSDDEVRVRRVDELLRSSGCLMVDQVELELGIPLFRKLQSIGMYDVSIVSNAKENVAFVTRPSAFAKYGSAAVSDAFDLAKALVASISYGIVRSHPGRGQIRIVHKLLGKLINGLWVGPATAIGEDYKILELKNVVQVRQERGLFSMKLLKREVGELALQVIAEGDASEQSLPNFPGASVTRFTPPEANRVSTRKNRVELDAGDVSDLLQSLRTGRHLR